MQSKLHSIIPSWTTLSVLGNSRFIRSSEVWIVIVPITAKIFSKLESIFTIEIWGHSYQLTLELPFSWELFFFSALAFAVASILYAVKCPALIKKYPDAASALAHGIDWIAMLEQWDLVQKETTTEEKNWVDEVIVLARQLVSSRQVKWDNRFDISRDVDSFIEGHHSDWPYPTEIDAVQTLGNLADNYPKSSQATVSSFWKLRSFLNNSRYMWRIVVTVIYTLGIALIIPVILSNIIYVVKML